MALFCIPPHMAEKLRNSPQLLTDTDIAKLKEMSTKQREKFFAERTNKEIGKFINTKFEKAVISADQHALLDWAKSTFKPTTKQEMYAARLEKLRKIQNPTALEKQMIKKYERLAGKNDTYTRVTDRINNLSDIGVLDKASKSVMFQDIASEKLGVSVSAKEIGMIHAQAKRIEKAANKVANSVGDPAKFEENMAFFKELKQMDDMLNSMTPAPKLRVATSTIGRGMMLASVKSPILNIGSNLEVGMTEKIARLIAIRSKNASTDLAKQYRNMVNKIYNETGYDLTRMTSLADTGSAGERVLVDVTHSQGKGAVRATGRVIEDIVFKNLMGKPDVMFAARHFADSAGRLATRMADGNAKKAKLLMKDAMRIEPYTPEGMIIRQQSILDAQVATWTNESWASKASLGLRKILNNLSGDYRLGDYFMPFVKTPANVISTGLDYAGAGYFKGAVKLVKAIRAGELGEKQVVQDITRDMVRAGLGTAGAFILASQFKPDDFVGAYDPGRKQIEQLRNSRDNVVRIGDSWVSLDWFGPLAVPMTAMLYAKKYGNGITGYLQGTGSAAMMIPGVEDIYDLYKNYSETGYKQGQSTEEAVVEAGKFVSGEFASRAIPSIMSDIAKMSDPYQRENNLISKIPLLSHTQKAKRNVFNEQIKSNNPIYTLLFGSRVQNDRETKAVTEIVRVMRKTGSNISFTDWNTTSSTKVAQFAKRLGDKKFEKAKNEYGQNLKNELTKLTSSGEYKKLSDEDKLSKLKTIDDKVRTGVFRKYNFVYKRQ